MIWREHIHKVVLRLPDSWSNWNLQMLVFEEKGKPEYPEKNLSEQRREPTTNSTHIWRRRQDLNLRHIGGRRALSTLRHPLLRLCGQDPPKVKRPCSIAVHHVNFMTRDRGSKRGSSDYLLYIPFILSGSLN